MTVFMLVGVYARATLLHYFIYLHYITSFLTRVVVFVCVCARADTPPTNINITSFLTYITTNTLLSTECYWCL